VEHRNATANAGSHLHARIQPLPDLGFVSATGSWALCGHGRYIGPPPQHPIRKGFGCPDHTDPFAMDDNTGAYSDLLHPPREKRSADTSMMTRELPYAPFCAFSTPIRMLPGRRRWLGKMGRFHELQIR